MRARKVVGFDRKLRIEWMDATAAKVADGLSLPELRDYLREFLADELSGRSFNSNMGKTITVLSHIWVSVPEVAQPLRDRALSVLDGLRAEERLAVHWAMMIATYPFVLEATETMGKIVGLQPEFSTSLLRKRIYASWGERRIVLNATNVLIRSLVDWGVLEETPRRGEFTNSSKRPVKDAVANLLVEAVLCGSHQEFLPSQAAINHSALFPFELNIKPGTLRNLPQFEIHRQGLDQEILKLRRD